HPLHPREYRAPVPGGTGQGLHGHGGENHAQAVRTGKSAAATAFTSTPLPFRVVPNRWGGPAPAQGMEELLELLLATVGLAQDRRDLREDLADAGAHPRNTRAGRDAHKPRHQSVLNQVLSSA